MPVAKNARAIGNKLELTFVLCSGGVGPDHLRLRMRPWH